jgi:hypothetical protein
MILPKTILPTLYAGICPAEQSLIEKWQSNSQSRRSLAEAERGERPRLRPARRKIFVEG